MKVNGDLAKGTLIINVISASSDVFVYGIEFVAYTPRHQSTYTHFKPFDLQNVHGGVHSLSTFS